jgi:2-(1,2-epoxy-1,2-dihydrophenyl)acetyl-CoA isomerase
MSTPDEVGYEVRDGVAVVTMAREESRNALSATMLEALADACTRAASEEMGALVLRSSGRVFCSGGDLAGLHHALSANGSEGVAGLVDQFHGVIRMVRSLPIPMVASINGPTIGAGVALAMTADVRLASRSSYFATGYLAVGATPDGGASFHLARALGPARALSAFLLNRRFGADELLTIGLVDDVVDDADLDAAAVATARRLSGTSLEALSGTRALVYAASEHGFDEHLEAEKDQFVRVSDSDAFRSAIARFGARAVTQDVR